MAGVDLGGGGGRRRALDSDINMIPMIDLLLVTISFLLITAVWTHMARINADAQVPGPQSDKEPQQVEPEKQLHVEMREDDKFVLIWKQGATTLNSIDVPRPKDDVAVTNENGASVVRYPELAQQIESQWKTNSQHSSPTDPKRDQAILHTDNKTQYKYIIGVIDAIYHTTRDVSLGGKTEKIPSFNVTFAVN